MIARESRVTPEQIVLLQQSFDQLLLNAEHVAEHFYARLFVLDPSLRVLFRTDMQAQGHKLMAMINVAINGLWFPESICPVLEQLGQRHVHYGVQVTHYETVRKALIWTLAQELGDQFTSDVAKAWSAAYGLLAQTMQMGAAHMQSIENL
jgi:hemoglobin-like flavoprotein